MSITVIYHISVPVPDEVWAKFKDTLEFEQKTLECTKGSIAGGTNFYSDVDIWADFHGKGDAVAAHLALESVIRNFQRRCV